MQKSVRGYAIKKKSHNAFIMTLFTNYNPMNISKSKLMYIAYDDVDFEEVGESYVCDSPLHFIIP